MRAAFSNGYLYLPVCRIGKNDFLITLSEGFLLTWLKTVTLRLFGSLFSWREGLTYFAPTRANLNPKNYTFYEHYQAKVINMAGKANSYY